MASFDQHAQSNPTSSANSPLFGLTFDAPPSLGAAHDSTFSFPSSKPPNPKRSNSTFLSPSPSHSSAFPTAFGAGLGSAFNSPLLGAYPTPTSQQKKKAKFTHHSPNNSLEMKKGAPPPLKLEGAFEEPGVGLGLGGAFSPVVPALAPAASTSTLSRTGGRLGASASFFLGDSEPDQEEPEHAAPSMSTSSSASSLSSLSSTASSDSTDFFASSRRDRLPTSSSFGSYTSSPPPPSRSTDKLGLGLGLGFGEAGFKCGTPSPMSSTFDLNDLSLEGLAESEEEGEMKVDGTARAAREEPADYWQAGKEAEELREKLGGWGWGRK